MFSAEATIHSFYSLLFDPTGVQIKIYNTRVAHALRKHHNTIDVGENGLFFCVVAVKAEATIICELLY